MYAIVEIAGLQYKVEQDQHIYVNRLAGNEGDKVTFDRVLLTESDGKVEVGAPVIEGATINGTILKHLKGDKVIVFKKKRRKGYQKSNGHRQYLTQIAIDITGAGASPKKAKATPKATKKDVAAADDLTKIEGVGPKIAELLVAAGLNSFAAVAASTPEKIAQILAEGGSQFASHNPTTWTKQAQLAADGKWDELKVWQDELDGGREA